MTWLIIVSVNGLSPTRHRAITRANAALSSIGPLGTQFNEILLEIRSFSFKKIHLKWLSAKCRPVCFGLNVFSGNSRTFVNDSSQSNSGITWNYDSLQTNIDYDIPDFYGEDANTLVFFSFQREMLIMWCSCGVYLQRQIPFSWLELWFMRQENCSEQDWQYDYIPWTKNRTNLTHRSWILCTVTWWITSWSYVITCEFNRLWW